MGMKTNMTTHVASLARLCYAFENQRSHNEPRDTLRVLLGMYKLAKHAKPLLMFVYGHEDEHDDTRCKPCTALLCIRISKVAQRASTYITNAVGYVQN